MTPQTNKMIEYCLGIAQEFEARRNRIRVFVKHNLSSGNANEIILRDFLARHSSTMYDVGQGFICDPSIDGIVSKQCDILVHDQLNFPLVYSDGSIKIVWPQATKMVIETKTSLDKKELQTAIENVISSKRTNSQITGIIFAFDSSNLSSIVKQLQNATYAAHKDEMPDAILLLNKGIIIHRWRLARMGIKEPLANTQSYAVRAGTGKNKSAMVITFLLLLFFDAVSRMDYATNANQMLIQALEAFTERANDDLIVNTSAFE